MKRKHPESRGVNRQEPQAFNDRTVFQAPESIAQLLRPFQVSTLRRPLGQEDLPDLRELLSLVSEAEARIRQEPNLYRFGAIDGLVELMPMPSIALGFPNPPLEAIRYERGVTRFFEAGDSVRRGFQFSPHPMDWPNLEARKRPRFLRAWGFRLHDPEGDALPKEVLISAHAELQDPSRPLTGDPWESQTKLQARAAAIETLLRWKRHLEKLIQSLKQPKGQTASKSGEHTAPATHSEDPGKDRDLPDDGNDAKAFGAHAIFVDESGCNTAQQSVSSAGTKHKLVADSSTARGDPLQDNATRGALPRRGRPPMPSADPEKDRRLFEDWKAAKATGPRTIAEFAQLKGIQPQDVRAALDRHRKREPNGKN